jgi:josephin
MSTGKDKLSKRVFDRAAAKLAPGSTFMNPHKSMFGLGNYDANILILILQDRFVRAWIFVGNFQLMYISLVRRGYQVDWYDRRREIKDLNFDSLFGIICNAVSEAPFGIVKFHHWYSVRKVRACVP